ncbi:uncharacterized protein LOC34620509 [Cyclospora cayetanensis]|uniref:Uncharacterized protein LOC34620509 n=1 Tax=Cyclospora cayetanensis TaxID=88456 RepID=A0A6P6RVR8_9EIME|nr:uncharacterized protein LOC34620509 [Cyclospora cayetanensis]
MRDVLPPPRAATPEASLGAVSLCAFGASLSLYANDALAERAAWTAVAECSPPPGASRGGRSSGAFPTDGEQISASEKPNEKLRVLARRRGCEEDVSVSYENSLCRVLLTFSVNKELTGPLRDARGHQGAREEIEAEMDIARSLRRASAVCEAVNRGASPENALGAEALLAPALVAYAFSCGREGSKGSSSSRVMPGEEVFSRAETFSSARQLVSFHLPSLSPAALCDLIFFCTARLRVRDSQFLEDAARVALEHLKLLLELDKPAEVYHRQPLHSRNDLPGPSAMDSVQKPPSTQRSPEDMAAQDVRDDDFVRRILEAPVRFSRPPSAHHMAKLLRGIILGGHEAPEVLALGVAYLKRRCTYTHSDLLHSLALLKVMPSGAPREHLAAFVAQKLILRERRLPLPVVAAAANVFSRVSLPPFRMQPESSWAHAERQHMPSKGLEALEGARSADALGFSVEARVAPNGPLHAGSSRSNGNDSASVLPSAGALYASLSCSAQRVLDVRRLGIGGSVRGRDLALLAHGFVKAGEDRAATSWVVAMERHWRELRPVFEPVSLALLLGSLPKLQHALPGNKSSVCLMALLHLLSQQVASLTAQQLVMVAAGLSRFPYRQEHPLTALRLVWRLHVSIQTAQSDLPGPTAVPCSCVSHLLAQIFVQGIETKRAHAIGYPEPFVCAVPSGET